MRVEIWEILLSLFNTITSFITAEYFFATFADKKNRRHLVSCAAFVVFFLTLLFVQNKSLNMAILILCTLAITLNFHMRFYNKVLFTVIAIALNFVAEIIAGFLIMNVFVIGFESAEQGIYMAFGILMSKLLVFIVYTIIRIAKNKTLFGNFRKSWVSIYILPAATMLVAYILYRSMGFYENNTSLKNISLISLILLIISNMLIIKLINDIHDSIVSESRLVMAEELVKQQEKQYRLLVENNETVIKLRHDYKNFLLGILSEINRGEYERTKKRLSDELHTFEELSKTAICGDSVLDTVLNYKKTDAQAKHIRMNCDCRNVHDIGISGVDLSVLLGNALDNAIEASQNLPDERDRVIDVSICRKGRQMIISIKNNVTDDKNAASLQTEKGRMHGYGIVNMKSIAAKYHGSVTFTCENNVFTTVILLSSDDE